MGREKRSFRIPEPSRNAGHGRDEVAVALAAAIKYRAGPAPWAPMTRPDPDPRPPNLHSQAGNVGQAVSQS